MMDHENKTSGQTLSTASIAPSDSAAMAQALEATPGLDEEHYNIRYDDLNLAADPEATALQQRQHALHQLAFRLRRPAQSLSAFAHLTEEQLLWLGNRVAEVYQREHQQLKTDLHQTFPWFLRPFLIRKFKKSQGT